MTMYAELYFAKNEDDIPISKYFFRLPDRIKNKIIKWKLELKYEDHIAWGVKGERIQLPMTYTMYRKMPLSLRGEVFKKIEKKLEQRGITHLILPKLIETSPFEHIKQHTGSYIKPFLIMEMIYFIEKEKILDKKLKHLEIVLLDGNKKEVDMMIDFIYPHINHLTIISHNPERFKEKSEEIFNDVGLNMQILSYTKGAISQGDIIIDTHYDDPSVIRFCKKDALYIDLGNNIQKTMMLLERQNKTPVINQFCLIKKGEVVSIEKAELLLDMKNIISRDYKGTMERLKKQDIKIYEFAK